MMKIAENRLLLATTLAFIAYWAIGFSLPWPAFSPVVNLLLVVAAGLTFLRYVPDAMAILFQGRRNEQPPEGDGSHLAVFGTTAVGLGGVLAAISAFALISPTLRPFVQETPAELFGTAVASAGLVLIFISPSVTKRGVNFGGGLWFYLAAAVAMVAIYALGFSAGFHTENHPVPEVESTALLPDLPRCSADRPVWVSGGGVYHDASSPYRKLVVPVRCFETVGEARAAGYREAG